VTTSVRALLHAGDASGNAALFYLAILLHGICYDFFFVAGQIYVDRTAPRNIQASAQGFITFITYGVGMLIGSLAAGWVVQGRQLADRVGNIVGHRWTAIWLVPAVMALAVTALFMASFRPGAAREGPSSPGRR
jgi:MFS family permease